VRVTRTVDLSEVLLTARSRLGVTQQRLAYLLGTSQANVSAYESGAKTMGADLIERVDALRALTAQSDYRHGWPNTLASLAATVRADLRGPTQDTDTLLRLVIQASDDANRLVEEPDLDFCLAQPGTSGSRRWNALIAALAVDIARRTGRTTTPGWTRDRSRYLTDTWWFGAAESIPSLRAMAYRDAPSSFRARGVMLSRTVLESV
jgi:transcriptional regulator with XRE-family HTH domain